MSAELTIAEQASNDIDGWEEYYQKDLKRYAFARGLLDELIPFLPHTLEQFFKVEGVWDGYGWPPECSDYRLRLVTRPDLPPDDMPLAFGTIVKVAAAMMRAGWTVGPQPDITANQEKRALDVDIKGTRGTTTLILGFLHLPESERCKLVETVVDVPARQEIKLKVVCEGQPLELGPPALQAAGIEAQP